jgi:hypothetical protein
MFYIIKIRGLEKEILYNALVLRYVDYCPYEVLEVA